MKNRDNHVITVEEIASVLDRVSEEFKMQLDHLEIQKERVVNFFREKVNEETALCLERDLQGIKEELSAGITLGLVNKEQHDLQAERCEKVELLEDLKEFVDEEQYFYIVSDLYQRYIFKTQNFLIQIVNDYKNIVPMDFVVSEHDVKKRRKIK